MIAGEGGAGDEGRIVGKPALDSEILIAPVEDAEAAADDGFARGLVSQAKPRREVIVIGVHQRSANSAAASIGDGDELRIARAAVQDEIRLPVKLLDEGRGQLVAQPEIQSQLAGCFPIVLNIGVVDTLLDGIHLLL